MKYSGRKIETLVLHGDSGPDPLTRSRAVPVYRTSSYMFDSTEHASDLFALKQPGNIYTRMMNPTQQVLEERMTTLEGGAGALALSSGTSAIFYAVINICRAGDEVVAMNNLYGGTHTMLNDILPQFGINTRFVSPEDFTGIDRAVNERTRLIFAETMGNPALGVADLEALASMAGRHHLPLVVDSTFTTPALLRPIEYGAHVVVHSLTKWLGGHGTGIGGIVVDSGSFDWSDPKFALYNEPEKSYHDIRFAHDLGEDNRPAYITRMRLVPLRNLGACISPDNAWMFLQGIETLPLRMERHCRNAMAVALYLKGHHAVDWVRYPGLEGDPSHEVAAKYLKKGFGGMVVFGIRGGYGAAVKLIDSIGLFSHLANVGDAKSLILHPASTSHAQLTPEEREEGGITDDFIRLSIGIEHIDDILEALEKGLAASQK